MKQKAKDLYLKNEQFARYLIMAVIIVCIEYGSYLGMLGVHLNYLVAVPLSMAVGIVLNWYFSRVFVFKNRRHAPHKEFMLVLAASLAGAALQTFVTYVVVQMQGTPALGKLVAIVVTFFWNYFIRKRYIF
jgi:putative flippase GtrA